jgi:hypothetical protein
MRKNRSKTKFNVSTPLHMLVHIVVVSIIASPLISIAGSGAIGTSASLSSGANLVEQNEFGADQNGLALYVYPSSRELNWETPKKALWSFLSIEIQRLLNKHPSANLVSDFGDLNSVSRAYRSTMGHTIAHVACTLPSGQSYDTWTSFSGQDYVEVDMANLLEKKMGLGHLFYDFIDGHIVSGEENIYRMVHYIKNSGGSPRRLKFNLNPEQCLAVQKMNEFFKSLHYKPGTPIQELAMKHADELLYFSVNMDPYETYMNRMTKGFGKVGGGCAPYVVSLLKIAGVYDSSLDAFFQLRIPVSERLIGSSDVPVPVGQLLFGSLGNSWTFEGYGNRPFVTYDPNYMWDFVGHMIECKKTNMTKCTPLVAAYLKSSPYNVKLAPAVQLSDTRVWPEWTEVGSPSKNQKVFRLNERTDNRTIEGLDML